MRNAISLKLNNKLREIRLKKKLSQTIIAHKCGISVSTYQNIEAGKSEPGVKTDLLIAQILDYKLDKLFTVQKYHHD